MNHSPFQWRERMKQNHVTIATLNNIEHGYRSIDMDAPLLVMLAAYNRMMQYPDDTKVAKTPEYNQYGSIVLGMGLRALQVIRDGGSERGSRKVTDKNQVAYLRSATTAEGATIGFLRTKFKLNSLSLPS